MPYTIKTGYLNVKDENGRYIRNNTVAEQSTAEQIAEIEAAGATQQAAIVAKGNETRQSIPSDYTALSNAVTAEVTAREVADNELKEAVSHVECPNLMGSNLTEYYPVRIKAGDKFTISTSDGSDFDGTNRVYWYDINRTYIDWGGLYASYGYKRTFTASTDIYYMTWYASASANVTYMVNYGDQALPYVEYYNDHTKFAYKGYASNPLSDTTVQGYYDHVNAFGDTTDLPGNYDDRRTGLLEVFSIGMSPYIVAQRLTASTGRMWVRTVNIKTGDVGSWAYFLRQADYNNIIAYVNNARFTDRKVSLSGNYFDYENADWQVGYDTGSSISQTSGYHYAFVRLVGPGTYIRVMRSNSFGTNAARVALYDKNKTYIKWISATRIESTDGFSFELTADDAITAVYTTVSYQDTYPNIVGLFYESDAYPLKAGLKAALPNYKPVSDPLYKSMFICDGDSICQAVADQPKYASGWWGRVILDYSADGKNYGVGGGTITSGLYYENGNPRHWVNESIDTIYSEYPALDYLILEGGTNDADLIGRFNGDTAPAKFGTWSETDFSGNYDNTTFCGAVDTMFYKAVSYWPKAKIGFIVAMQMGTNNASSANRRRYFNEIEAIAKKWHIPVLDLWDESQMDARLTIYYDPSMTSAENVAAGKCYYDGQHPTSYGYDLMQGKIDNWIHSL